MSVLAELSIFPMDKGASVGEYVAPVVQLIRDAGVSYQLTAMGTIIETEQLHDALSLLERAEALLKKQGCQRVYATLKLDIREGPMGRLESKVQSVSRRISDLKEN
jgi:uncharacterized protein (TIGR00106 family)